MNFVGGIVLLCLIASARSAVITWSSLNIGFFTDTTYWSPQQIPTSQDSIFIQNGSLNVLGMNITLKNIQIANGTSLVLIDTFLYSDSLQAESYYTCITLSNATLTTITPISVNSRVAVLAKLSCRTRMPAPSYIYPSLTLKSAAWVYFDVGAQLTTGSLTIEPSCNLYLWTYGSTANVTMILADSINGEFNAIREIAPQRSAGCDNVTVGYPGVLGDVRGGRTICPTRTGVSIGIIIGAGTGRGSCPAGIYCSTGWTGPQCDIPICPSNCSGHGTCMGNLVVPYCTCVSGWSGSDCNAPICPGSPIPCGGAVRGTCNSSVSPPTCVCNSNWTGADCTTLIPPPSSSSSSSSPPSTTVFTGITKCNGTSCGGTDHGLCDFNTNQCVCNTQNWVGDQCQTPVCNGDLVVPCSGNGRCDVSTSLYHCICDQYWSGAKCDKPICPSDCSGRGTCSGSTLPPVCACFVGWTGVSCNQQLGIDTLPQTPTDANQRTSDVSTVTPTAPPPTRTINYNDNKDKEAAVKKKIIIAVSCSVGGIVLVLIVAAILIGPMRLRSLVAQKPMLSATDSQQQRYGLLEEEKNAL